MGKRGKILFGLFVGDKSFQPVAFFYYWNEDFTLLDYGNYLHFISNNAM